MREFNVTGLCVPNRHYMVDISEKIEKIFKLVEGEKYFTINRGSQYGKTTTIGMLRKRLPDDYLCASLSFQFSSRKMYADEAGFCQEFLYSVFESLEKNCPEEAKEWVEPAVTDFKMLSRFITKICRNSQRKIVLIIDEADEASNNAIFIMFIKMLRDKFL